MSGARTVGVRWTTDFHRRVMTMRALKAEAEVEKLRAEVEKLRVEVEGLKLREEVLYDFATKYLCPWETECLKPFHDASDCVDCWEKFLAREEAREREEDGGRESA
jgi:hypothetical protein